MPATQSPSNFHGFSLCFRIIYKFAVVKHIEPFCKVWISEYIDHFNNFLQQTSNQKHGLDPRDELGEA